MGRDKARPLTRGVIYLSRPPPFMKPARVRHLLSQYGEITNLFLVPEDTSRHQRRVKSGGNSKIRYTEGWAEFASKKIAKSVAETLNGSRIGGKKRAHFSEDLWNLKYLRGFKWAQLAEKNAYEKRVREQRLRSEIAQTKREGEFFRSQVEQNKRLKGIEQRKRARAEAEGGSVGGAASGQPSASGNSSSSDHKRARRRFRQQRGRKGEEEGNRPALTFGSAIFAES